MFEDNQSNSDANLEVSSEPQSTESQDSLPSAEVAVEAQPKEDIASQLDKRLDQHPRFKELIAQKNEYAKTVDEMRRQYADLEKRLSSSQPKAESAEDKLISRLKGIDPEFGSRIEDMWSRVSKVDTLEQRLQAYEMAQARTSAESQFKSLLSEHKVPDFLHEAYQLKLQNLASSTPGMKLSDLPELFKSVHDQYSKMIDSIKRSERESYVSSKKADTKAPTSQPRGKNVPVSQAKQYSNDPQEAKSQKVADILKMIRADKDV